MNPIKAFFLRARHWQVFVVLVGLFCVAQIVVIKVNYPSQGNMQIPLPALVAALVCWICFAYWFWCLGMFFYSLERPDLRAGLSFFGFSLFYPILYAAFFQLVFEKLRPAYILAMFPFHILAFCCVMFGLNFVSRSLVSAEKQRRVSFSEYAWPFFSLWFFPIGIWIIQPRINRLYASAQTVSS